ncbi:MAG: PCMD domain-containing protein, partial [Porphyromonadaceae bacterium]|nr:PCMD domain-containing protein [Porphyromonadaceae bacterium]
KGSAVSIESRPGKITAGMGKYLVAGSLYSGEARVNKFLSKPLESTLFGQPIEEIPVKLSGYYKYKSGPKYINGETDAPYPNKKDQGTIAVVFYEAPDLDFFLDGNNLYTDKHIIAYKQHFVDDSNWDEWTPFEIDIPVTNKDLYKSIDFLAKKYKIAIVFSSSRRGDQFLGAVGSLLLIDEITLTTEK